MRGQVMGLVVLAAVVTGPAAWADGAPIMPAIGWRHLSEQKQAAVVSVKADRTATVDLFISLLAKPGAPKEMHFLLPLQTLPKEFHAREVGSEQFAREKFEPLQRVMRAAQEREREAKERAGDARLVGAFLAGPGALAAVLVSKGPNARAMGSAHQGMLGMPTPALSVATKHTAADIYPSLKPQEVAALAKAPDLPREVRDTLARYAGRPFALIRLQFLSSPEGEENELRSWRRDVPGVQFTFAQEMRPVRSGVAYDFPLGTGTAWAEPVANTVVCVTGPDDLNLRVDFPAPDEELGGKEYFLQRYVRTAAAEGRQVYAVSYSEGPGGTGTPPARDIPITLLTRGTSPAVAERNAFQRLALALTVGLPLLGVAAWLIPFHLIVARGRKLTRGGWFRLAGGSWLAAQVIGVVLPLGAVGLGQGPAYSHVRSVWRYSWVWYLFDSEASGVMVVLVCFAIVWVTVLWLVTRKLRGDAALFGLAALAVVVSGVIYAAVSAVLMGARA